MNLYFRLLWTFLRAWRFQTLDPLEGCFSRFRVMFFDIDLFGHMNNGRYLQAADVARVDWMMRNGVMKHIHQSRWSPILGGSVIRFSQELKLFQRFDIHTHLISWDDRWFYIEHQFVTSSGRIAAVCITRAAMRDKSGWVSTKAMLSAIAPHIATRPIQPEKVRHWLKSDSQMSLQRQFQQLRRSSGAAPDYLRGCQSPSPCSQEWL